MKICFKLVTGENYTLSHEVYGGNEPLDEARAVVQIGFILTKMAYFVCDQGEAISAQHIVSAHVEP